MKRWPKKVYFLDGPMEGKTAKVSGGLFITIPVRTNEGMTSWIYEWDMPSLYPNANVVYAWFRA